MIHLAGSDYRCVWEGKAVGENTRIEFSRTHGKGYPNTKYKAFKDGLAWMMRARMRVGLFETITGPVSVLITHRSNFDIDNLTKPILDALEDAGVIENDRNVRRLHVESERKGRGELDGIVVEVGRAIG